MTYNDFFDKRVVQPFIDSIPSIIRELTSHFTKLVKEQVAADAKHRGDSCKWTAPRVRARNLHAEFEKTSRQRVTTFLKVSATHPSSPWVGAYHGMRLLKEGRIIQDVAANIFNDGYDYGVRIS